MIPLITVVTAYPGSVTGCAALAASLRARQGVQEAVSQVLHTAVNIDIAPREKNPQNINSAIDGSLK
jgi:hypothetical protein